MRSLDAGFVGPVFAAPQPSRRSLHPRRRAALSRVAAHIAAIYRLRTRLRSASGNQVEAILDPRHNRAVHLEASVADRSGQRALEAASARLGAARGALRKQDPTRALALWRCLVDGQWSLVDRVDQDGRRFLLARRNAPVVDEPRSLSPRERQVLALLALGHSEKLVAYELGLAPSTVSLLARSASQKLGLTSRTDLMRVVGRTEPA
jgi:DNA-binding NarL/FixJ family response regulator